MSNDTVPGPNLYRYCHNNPVNAVDPSGLSEHEPYLKKQIQWNEDEMRRRELRKQREQGLIDVEIPKSDDGTDGFGLHITKGELIDIRITSVRGTRANRIQDNIVIGLVPNATIEEQIRQRLRGEDIDFTSLPAGAVIDEDKKKEINDKLVRVVLNKRKLYFP
jgi:hypothetical protein